MLGVPGAGKSFLLERFSARCTTSPRVVHLAATTGKASNLLSKSCNTVRTKYAAVRTVSLQEEESHPQSPPRWLRTQRPSRAEAHAGAQVERAGGSRVATWPPSRVGRTSYTLSASYGRGGVGVVVSVQAASGQAQHSSGQDNMAARQPRSGRCSSAARTSSQTPCNCSMRDRDTSPPPPMVSSTRI